MKYRLNKLILLTHLILLASCISQHDDKVSNLNRYETINIEARLSHIEHMNMKIVYFEIDDCYIAYQ